MILLDNFMAVGGGGGWALRSREPTYVDEVGWILTYGRQKKIGAATLLNRKCIDKVRVLTI